MADAALQQIAHQPNGISATLPTASLRKSSSIMQKNTPVG